MKRMKYIMLAAVAAIVSAFMPATAYADVVWSPNEVEELSNTLMTWGILIAVAAIVIVAVILIRRLCRRR